MHMLVRYLQANFLFLTVLAVSVTGHVSLGWLRTPTLFEPQMAQVESGRTSVAVQLIAQSPSSEMHEFPEPLPVDRTVPVPTPMLDQQEPRVRLQRKERFQEVLQTERDFDFQQMVAARQPPQVLPERTLPEDTTLPETELPTRPAPAVRRHESQQVVEIPPAEIDVPETVVSQHSTGTEVPPAFVARPLPPYPEDLLLRHIEGVVQLLVSIDRDGRVSTAKVYSTSGFQEMDDSALRTVRTWVFTPARRGGTPVGTTVVVPVRFEIRQ